MYPFNYEDNFWKNNRKVANNPLAHFKSKGKKINPFLIARMNLEIRKGFGSGGGLYTPPLAPSRSPTCVSGRLLLQPAASFGVRDHSGAYTPKRYVHVALARGRRRRGRLRHTGRGSGSQGGHDALADERLNLRRLGCRATGDRSHGFRFRRLGIPAATRRIPRQSLLPEPVALQNGHGIPPLEFTACFSATVSLRGCLSLLEARVSPPRGGYRRLRIRRRL